MMICMSVIGVFTDVYDKLENQGHMIEMSSILHKIFSPSCTNKKEQSLTLSTLYTCSPLPHAIDEGNPDQAVRSDFALLFCENACVSHVNGPLFQLLDKLKNPVFPPHVLYGNQAPSFRLRATLKSLRLRTLCKLIRQLDKTIDVSM